MEPELAFSAASSRIDFELRPNGAGSVLHLAPCQLFGWLTLEQLELSLPGDMPSSALAAQRRRGIARDARLRMSAPDLTQLVAGYGSELAQLGVDELALRAQEGHIALTARVRESALVADLSARIYLTVLGSSEGDDVLRFSVGQPTLYGHLDTPAPVLAHRLLVALLRLAESNGEVAVLGLGDLTLRPLASVLLRCMPAAGYRVPKLRDLIIDRIVVDSGGIVLDYGERGRVSQTESGVSQQAIALTKALETFRSHDLALCRGDIETALRGYRGELAARGPEQAFLVERILAIASARREEFADGLELARQVLGRWPDFAPAHGAIASIAVAQGDVRTAAERYTTMVQASSSIGDEENTVRAALAGARLTRQFAKDRATKLYELILDYRPDNAEAAEALADQYRDQNRWSDLVRLIRTRLSTTDDPQRQASDHARLAQVLYQHLGDTPGALDELRAASRLDPKSPLVLEQRAQVEFALGLHHKALESLESALELYEERDELSPRLRALVQGGQACLDLQDYSLAEHWFERALELRPQHSQATSGMARACAGLERFEDAARYWRELLDAGIEAPVVQALYACELGSNLIAAGHASEAWPPLERAIATGDAEIRGQAHSLLARLAAADGDLALAAEHLDRAVTELGLESSSAGRRGRAAELAVERANLLLQLGGKDEAIAVLTRAFAAASPGSLTRKQAARRLLERTPQNQGELAWLDELVADNPSPTEVHYLAIRRALILQGQGNVDAALAVIEAALGDEVADEPRAIGLQTKAALLEQIGDARARADVLSRKAALAGNNVQRAQASVESAEGWLQAEDRERALANAKLALQTIADADSDEAHSLRLRALLCMCECAWKMRDWSEVDRSCQALFTAPSATLDDPSELLFRWGTALEKLGRASAAVHVLEQLVARNDSPALVAQSSRLLGNLYEQLDDIANAAHAFERFAASDAVELSDAARADAWYRAGELMRRRPELVADAIRCLDEALKIASDHLPALDALERIARDAQNHDRLAVILGRKVAALAKHPQRQKALLVRLAELQAETLGRHDVARETYQRALTIDDSYRPALRFVARDLHRRGDFPGAAGRYVQLAGTLAADPDLAIDAEELEGQRREAVQVLAEIIKATAGEEVDDAVALVEDRARATNDLILWNALESVYRRRDNLVALSAVLGARASRSLPNIALGLDLERIQIAQEMGDRGAALLALEAALERNPDAAVLLHLHEELVEPAPMPRAQAERQARLLIDEGKWIKALEILARAIEPSSSTQWLQVEAALAAGRFDTAANVLARIVDEARGSGDSAGEHHAVRKLAEIALEVEGDHGGALTLYQRALELDPDDLVAAEMYADLIEHAGDQHRSAAVRAEVLDIARRTDAGPSEEASALKKLADQARARGDFDTACRHLEEACRLDPDQIVFFRERADLALTLRDNKSATVWLEIVLDKLEAGVGGPEYQGEALGDLALQLADIYYDQTGELEKARSAMLRAAEAFGEGSRRTATLRLLATEAAAAEAFKDAIDAYEAMGTGALTNRDRVQVAKLYQRVERDHAAVKVLEAARADGALSEEGSLLLFALQRSIKSKTALAESLEAGARSTPPGIATTRLLEALKIYDQALGDQAASQRIRERLARLAPDDAEERGDPSLDELECAAQAAAAGDDPNVACDLLSRVVVERARGIAREGSPIDSRTLFLLESLRDMVRSTKSAAAQPSQFEALATALVATAAIERDGSAAADLLREAANIRRVKLHDTRGAADCLSRALALRADDSFLLKDLDEALRDWGDYAQLVAAYEIHLGSVRGGRRALPLLELARIYRDVFREHDSARSYYEAARDADAELSETIGREMRELSLPPVPRQVPEPIETGPTTTSHELDRGAALEAEGHRAEAIACYERAAASTADDARPLEALRRLYEVEGNVTALCSVLERLALAMREPAEQARVLYQHARLVRDHIHDEELLNQLLRRAFACAPDDLKISNALRSLAIARGEWALAAELTYRQIAVASHVTDQAALYLELALIYDERLLDPGQAVANYEQALALDPDIPAAPRPLARLYELSGRNADAAKLYEQAAARSPDPMEQGRLLRHAAMNAERAGNRQEAMRLYSLVALTGDNNDGQAARAAIDRIGTLPDRAAAELRKVEARLARATDDSEIDELSSSALSLAARIGDPAAVERHAESLLRRGGHSEFVAELKSKATQDKDWTTLASLVRARASIAEDPSERAELFFELGSAYQYDLADANAAVGAYEQALEAQPDHPPTLDALAEIYFQRRDWLQAHKLYRRMSAHASNLPGAVLELRKGQVAESLGYEQEAFEHFRAATALDADNKEALAGLGRTALRAGHVEQALEAQQLLLSMIPGDQVEELRRARLQLANLARQSGDPISAIYYYELVLSEDPSSVTALGNLQTLYRERGDHLGSARVLRTLIAMTPAPVPRADLLFRLGETYRDAGTQNDLAADAYLKAIDLDPTHVATLRRLLDYYWKIAEPASVVEMARELAKQDALLLVDTGLRTLLRTALCAALGGATDLVRAIGQSLGNDTVDEIAKIVREADRLLDDVSAADLAEATRALCAATGDDPQAVARWLRRATGDNLALITALSSL